MAEKITGEVLKKLESVKSAISEKCHAVFMIDQSVFHSAASSLEYIERAASANKAKCVVIAHGTQNYSALKNLGNISLVEAHSIARDEVLRYVDKAECLYIVALSVANAAKICELSDEGHIPFAVQYALLRGKKVFASDLCAGLDTGSINVNYYRELEKVKKRLEEFGIAALPAEQKCAAQEEGKPSRIDAGEKKKKRLVSMEDVKNLDRDVFEVEDGLIITPLAMDYLRSKGIKLIKR